MSSEESRSGIEKDPIRRSRPKSECIAGRLNEQTEGKNNDARDCVKLYSSLSDEMNTNHCSGSTSHVTFAISDEFQKLFQTDRMTARHFFCRRSDSRLESREYIFNGDELVLSNFPRSSGYHSPSITSCRKKYMMAIDKNLSNLPLYGKNPMKLVTHVIGDL